jgi:hypothetical protein
MVPLEDDHGALRADFDLLEVRVKHWNLLLAPVLLATGRSGGEG